MIAVRDAITSYNGPLQYGKGTTSLMFGVKNAPHAPHYTRAVQEALLLSAGIEAEVAASVQASVTPPTVR